MEKIKESNELFDGKWKNDLFTVEIKGETYKSFYDGKSYGKGNFEYANGKFILTSFYARKFIFWVRFTEIVSGKYSITENGVIISNIEGRYSDYNGIWEKI